MGRCTRRPGPVPAGALVHHQGVHRRRRILLLATALSLAGLAGGITLGVALGQPILAVFGIIVALAPWGP